MAAYELRITAAAAKDLDSLPRKKDRQAVVARIRALADDPRPPGCVKLSGLEALYRVRQGRYRILYSIKDRQLVIVIIQIADRKDVYRRKRRASAPGRTRRFRSSDS